MTGRASIKTYLQNRNDWPLNNYFTGQDTGDGIELNCPASLRENIAYMEPDDDIHYTLIALHVMEQYGRDFLWTDVANAWNSCLPYNAICTAETQGILNYCMTTTRMRTGSNATPEFASTYRNPYREWIETYSSDDFEALASELEELLDRLAEDTPAVRDAYRYAMACELDFFAAAIG